MTGVQTCALPIYVDDPVAVVKEAARVVQPGGRVGIFDSDFSTIAFGYPNPAQGKSYDDALIKALVTNPRIMRQMPRVLRAAGLELVAAFPYVLADIGQADYWLASVESYRRLLPQGGTMTAEEADAWADALLQDSEAGVFFGDICYECISRGHPEWTGGIPPGTATCDRGLDTR